MPDPDEVLNQMEEEMQRQIEHNLKCGLIKVIDDRYFHYSAKGLFFLWIQSIKDRSALHTPTKFEVALSTFRR